MHHAGGSDSGWTTHEVVPSGGPAQTLGHSHLETDTPLTSWGREQAQTLRLWKRPIKMSYAHAVCAQIRLSCVPGFEWPKKGPKAPSHLESFNS